MRADLVDDLESAARDGSNGRRVNALLREAALALRALRDAPVGEVVNFDMLAHLARQAAWSAETFGPGYPAQQRTKGVLDHIRKELNEIEADPFDLTEWIDVVILALDGAWRAGYTPQQIIDALVAKQTKNERRVWPDWRTMPADKAIEHDRAHDAASVEGKER